MSVLFDWSISMYLNACPGSACPMFVSKAKSCYFWDGFQPLWEQTDCSHKCDFPSAAKLQPAWWQDRTFSVLSVVKLVKCWMFKSYRCYLNLSYLALGQDDFPELYGCRDLLSFQEVLGCVWPSLGLSFHLLRFLLWRSSSSLLDGSVGSSFCFWQHPTVGARQVLCAWGQPEECLVPAVPFHSNVKYCWVKICCCVFEVTQVLDLAI